MIFHVIELSVAWNVGALRSKYPKNLKSPKISSLCFDKDSNMVEISVDFKVKVAPELQHRMISVIRQLLPKEADGA